MLAELDLVALTRDLPVEQLQCGDVGAIVHRYQDGAAYEVEFAAAGGAASAVLTLDHTAIRPLDGHEILHVRERGRTSA